MVRVAWCRNGKESTDYGASPLEGSLTPELHRLIHKDAHQVILDGEMGVYDPVTESLVPFGALKTTRKGGRSDDMPKDHTYNTRVVCMCLLMDTDVV